jgi:hypothetical protein
MVRSHAPGARQPLGVRMHFPDEDLKRLWDILESFQLDAWGYRGEIEAEMERRKKGE